MSSWKDIRALSLVVQSDRTNIAPFTVLNIVSKHVSKEKILSFGPLDRPGTFSLACSTAVDYKKLLDLGSIKDGTLTLHFSSSSDRKVFFRVHGLPAYVTNEGVHKFMNTFGRVLSVRDQHYREPGWTHVASGVREVVILTKDISLIPHFHKFGWDGESFSIILTSPQRDPVCFKCRKVGHTRQDCQSKWCKICRGMCDHSTVDCPKNPENEVEEDDLHGLQGLGGASGGLTPPEVPQEEGQLVPSESSDTIEDSEKSELVEEQVPPVSTEDSVPKGLESSDNVVVTSPEDSVVQDDSESESNKEGPEPSIDSLGFSPFQFSNAFSPLEVMSETESFKSLEDISVGSMENILDSNPLTPAQKAANKRPGDDLEDASSARHKMPSKLPRSNLK